MTNIDKYLEDLQSADVAVRASAAESLCLAGEEASCAAAALVKACGDADEVQEWAVSALESLGTPSVDQLPEIATLISASNPVVAYWAVTLCGRLESAAAECEPELIRVLSSSSDAAVLERAAWSLGKINTTSPAAITALRVATESGSPRLARVAQTALDESAN